MNKRMSKSVRKHIRQEKARFRREISDPQRREEMIDQLYARFNPSAQKRGEVKAEEIKKPEDSGKAKDAGKAKKAKKAKKEEKVEFKPPVLKIPKKAKAPA